MHIFPPHAISGFLECTGLPLLLVWFSLFKMQQTYKKMFLLWNLHSKSDKSLVTFALLCAWKDSYLLFLCLYSSLVFFVCTLWVGTTDWLGWFLSTTSCSAFGFSLQGLGGTGWCMKSPWSASVKPLLDRFQWKEALHYSLLLRKTP